LIDRPRSHNDHRRFFAKTHNIRFQQSINVMKINMRMKKSTDTQRYGKSRYNL